MKKLWSKFWKSSSQRRKQRKYVHNAPLHIKHKFMAVNLSKDLKQKYSFRSLPVRKSDTVKILTGDNRGKQGKVMKVSLVKMAVFVESAEVKRADGSKVLYPIHPSNLQIVKLDLSDKKRVEKIEKLKKKVEVKNKDGK